MLIGKNFVFVHIGKNAGTSIGRALAPYRDWSCTPHDPPLHIHDTAENIRSRIGREEFDSRFVFAFLRHPATRMVSLYEHAKRDIADTGSFAHFVRSRTVDHVCNDLCRAHGTGCLAAQQFDSVVARNGELLADFLGRYESLDTDFAEVCNRIGVQADLPRLNASVYEQTPAEYYDQETRKLVEDFYAEDFELGGYEWESIEK